MAGGLLEGRAGAGWAVGTMWWPWGPGGRNTVTGSLPSPCGCKLASPQFLRASQPLSGTLGPVLRLGAAPTNPHLSNPLPHLLVLGPSSQRLPGALGAVGMCVCVCKPGSPLATWLCLFVSQARSWDGQGERSGLSGRHPGRCPEPGPAGLGHKQPFPQGRRFAILLGHRLPFLWQLQVFSAVIWTMFFFPSKQPLWKKGL